MRKAFVDPKVEQVFDTYSPAVRGRLMQLRMLIYSVASEIEEVGDLEETLKWGHPSYLTAKSKSGSTIRLGREKKTEGDFGIYFKCQTSLVAGFKKRYKGLFRFEGNRAILFNVEDEFPVPELSDCIAKALTYNLDKKRERLAAKKKDRL